MKIAAIFLVGFAALTSRVQAQSAPKLHKGLFQIVFNLSSRVSRVDVTQSTGSATLDQKVIDYARASWRGLSGTAEPVVIDPTLRPLKDFSGYDLRVPDLPVLAGLGADKKLSGVCLVTFDASGRVASQLLTRSTGWPALDRNILGSAKDRWLGRPNTTVAVPVTYRLKE